MNGLNFNRSIFIQPNLKVYMARPSHGPEIISDQIRCHPYLIDKIKIFNLKSEINV